MLYLYAFLEREIGNVPRSDPSYVTCHHFLLFVVIVSQFLICKFCSFGTGTGRTGTASFGSSVPIVLYLSWHIDSTVLNRDA